jgi:hypothetical protein
MQDLASNSSANDRAIDDAERLMYWQGGTASFRVRWQIYSKIWRQLQLEIGLAATF